MSGPFDDDWIAYAVLCLGVALVLYAWTSNRRGKNNADDD